MAIMDKNQALFPFEGDMRPIAIMDGNNMIYEPATSIVTGESASFANTYNHHFNSLIADGAEPQSLADWHGASGLISQAGTPTPTAPIAVTANITAGSYKIACPAGGCWLINLTDDLQGISTYLDKVNVDLITGKCKVRKKVSKKVFDGTETWLVRTGDGAFVNCSWYQMTLSNAALLEQGLSTHFALLINNIADYEHIRLIPGNAFIGMIISKSYAVDLTAFKSYLASQYTAGTPVTVYYVLATETVTDLTLTHADTSALTELTLADLGITTSSLEYPYQIYEANNNSLAVSNATEVKQTVNLPTLRAIGAVKDRYDISSGVKTKKVSEWITLDGSLIYTFDANKTDYKKFHVIMSVANTNGLTNTQYFSIAYRYDGLKLLSATDNNKNGIITWVFVPSAGLHNYIGVPNIDSGMSETVTPTTGEVKAYFLGWQMCHDDGSSPYYKSEVPYTPSTWAEWGKSAGVTVDSTGLSFNGGTKYIYVTKSTQIKASTKYGLLYNVVNSNVTGNLTTDMPGVFSAYITFPKLVGNNKAVLNSISNITDNKIFISLKSDNEPSGNSIKIKDIRIFELPTGSQIEADFTNLTADELAIKYPFYGLNPKNWKHITDGTGLTSTLPTATYAGYNPYRLLYQLATPVDEQLTGVNVPTYFPETEISQSGDKMITLTAESYTIV